MTHPFGQARGVDDGVTPQYRSRSDLGALVLRTGTPGRHQPPGGFTFSGLAEAARRHGRCWKGFEQLTQVLPQVAAPSSPADRGGAKRTKKNTELREAGGTQVRRRQVAGRGVCAARHQTTGLETRLEQWTGPDRCENPCHRKGSGDQTLNRLETRTDSGQDRKTGPDWTSELDSNPVYLRGLPPYNPEDSTLPPIPDKPVDGEYLMQRYGLSKAAFYARKNYLPVVKGTRTGKKVHFGPEEVFLFDACDHYLRLGFSLQEIREAQEGLDEDLAGAPGEQVEVKPLGKTDTETTTLSVSPNTVVLAQVLGPLVTEAVRAAAPQPERDPLRTLRLLEEAADKQYLLTNKMLADTLEFKRDSVRSFNEIEHRHGFELRKLGVGKWKVRRLTDEEIEADLAAEQRAVGKRNWFGRKDAA